MTEVEKRLNHKFSNLNLLERALTHKSFSNELKGSVEDNETLEFLGDAVIDLVIGEYLMELFPKDKEGSLSKKRASVVNEQTLSVMAQDLQLSKYMHLGKGESQSGGAEKPRLISSCFEAVIGAIFLDGGFEVAKQIIRERFKSRITEIEEGLEFEKDYKTRLQEVIQKEFKLAPHYEVIGESGPSHDRIFTSEVRMQDQVLAVGTGKSKKMAEQEAARLALEKKGLK